MKYTLQHIPWIISFTQAMRTHKRTWFDGRVSKNFPKNRMSMTPQLFEALDFLNKNDRFWDPKLVCQAIHGARSERAANNLEDHRRFS